MCNELRQEARLPRSEMLFLEVHSSFDSALECKILICSSADVSANGVRAHIDESLPLNAIYQLCVQLDDGFRRLYLAAQVKWLKSDEQDSGYYVGLEILDSDGSDVDKWKDHVADLLQG